MMFTSNVQAFDAESATELLSRLVTPTLVRPLEGEDAVELTGTFGALKNVRFWEMRLPVGAQFTLREATDCYYFDLPLSGSSTLRTRSETLDSTLHEGVVVECALIHSLRLSPGRTTLGLGFDRLALIQRLSLLLEAPVRNKLVFKPRIDMRSGAGAALARLAACLNSGGVGPTVTMAPLTGDQVAAMMIDFVIETLPHNYSDHLCGKPKLIAPRHVRRAVDHIHAHLTESLSIDDLAELSGVSRRALHYGFKRFIGSSPADYQRSERLVAARRDIEANPDETVAVVAHRWGFSNAGRFNQQFRLRFGESAASLRARVRLRPGAESPD